MPIDAPNHFKKNHTPTSKVSKVARKPPSPTSGVTVKAVRKPGPKAIHRKDITLPPTVLEAAQREADAVGMSDVDYFNAAVVAYFSKVLTGDHDLIEPIEQCPTCGKKGSKLTKPNGPPESGFVRVRVGVRFTDNVAKMLFQLAEDWFKGTWSHAFEFAVRNYLGKKNPPPEGKGKYPGVQLKPRKRGTAAEQRVIALARGMEK